MTSPEQPWRKSATVTPGVPRRKRYSRARSENKKPFGKRKRKRDAVGLTGRISSHSRMSLTTSQVGFQPVKHRSDFPDLSCVKILNGNKLKQK